MNSKENVTLILNEVMECARADHKEKAAQCEKCNEYRFALCSLCMSGLAVVNKLKSDKKKRFFA